MRVLSKWLDGLGGFAARARSGFVDPPANAVLLRRLSRLHPHGSGARALGREYLARAPWEASRGRLLELILGLPAGCHAALATLDEARLREAIQHRLKRDLERGHIVEVGGRKVPRTEARLCALAYV
jgi:hypothetical protein